MNNKRGILSKAKAHRVVKGKSGSSSRWLQRQLTDSYVAAAHSQGYRSRAAFKLLEAHHKLHRSLIRPSAFVLDLGAAPGGFSQVAAQLVSHKTNHNNNLNNNNLNNNNNNNNNNLNNNGFVLAVDEQMISPPLPPPVHYISASLNLRDVDYFANLFLTQLQLHIEKTSSSSSSTSSSSTTNGNSNPTPLLLKNNNKVGYDVVLSDMAPFTCGDGPTDHIRMMECGQIAFEIAKRCLKPAKGSLFVKVTHGSEDVAFRKQLADHFGFCRPIKPPASRSDSKEYYLYATSLPQKQTKKDKKVSSTKESSSKD